MALYKCIYLLTYLLRPYCYTIVLSLWTWL